jgi:hypothetical protein
LKSQKIHVISEGTFTKNLRAWYDTYGQLHWNWKMMSRHTYEELGIMVLEYGRDRRGSSFRVCRTAAEGDTLVVCFTKVSQLHVRGI